MKDHVLLWSIISLICLFAFSPGNAQAQADQTTPETDAETQAPQPFRVMSFNIRWGGAADPPSVWSDRRERVIKTIQAYDPDILGVQESLLSQSKYLLDELDGYVFFGAGRDNGRRAGEMCAIYYRAKRFLRIGGGHFWLSEEPDQPGSMGWDATYPRMVSWLRLRDKTNRRTLLVANTHWDHHGDKARLHSAKLILERLPRHVEPDDAVILMGDFNCDEDSEPYRILTNQESPLKLIDAYRAVHPERTDQEATYHGFQGKTKGSRIDWILHSPDLQTLAAEIDTSHEGLKYPSDHFPVTATLRFAE